jgi:hypothetical protein
MSETIRLQDKYGPKIPWILPKSVRIPRIRFPVLTDKMGAIPTPSKTFAFVAILVFFFWLAMGGIYIQIRKPIALGADAQGKPLWLYPSTSEAFVIESIVAAIIIYIGSFGFILLYNATKNAYNKSYAQTLIIIGMIMVGVSFGVLQWIVNQKGG